jgi:tetratricopeptide (TPR) repeat protein
MIDSLPARKPEEFAPLLAAANAHDRAGRVDEAIAAYREIVWRRPPQSHPSVGRLVDLLETHGRRAEALAILVDLAALWQATGYFIHAHVTWLRAHWLVPDDPAPLLGLARASGTGGLPPRLGDRAILQRGYERLIAIGRHADARELKAAATFGPEDVVEHELQNRLQEITTMAETGRHEEAVNQADRIAIDTDRLDVRARLRDIYSTCGDWTRAAGTSRAIARALREEGRHDEATVEDARADLIDPTRPAVWVKSARRSLRDGQLAQARRALDRAIPLASGATLREVREMAALTSMLQGTAGRRVPVSAGVAAIEMRPRDGARAWVAVGGTNGSLLIPEGWELKVRLGGLDEEPGTPADLAAWPADAVVALDLSFTRIGDDDLAAVARFTRLRRLSVDCTDMAWGAVPMESRVGLHIGHLFDDTRGKGVTSAGVAHLAGLTELRHLGLGTTGIDDDALPYLRGVRKLEVLKLDRTRVRGSGLRSLPTALRELDLARSRLDFDALETLARFQSLEVLHLDGMLVDGERLTTLERLPLHTLTVKKTPVETADLVDLRQLRSLDLSGTDLDDEGVVHLAALERLTVLGVRETRLGDNGLLALAGAPSLRRLCADVGQFSDAAVEGALKVNPNLVVERTGQVLDLHLDDPE